MSFSSLDADYANGRELHNQSFMDVWLLKSYFYFFIFVVVNFYVNFCLAYFLWAVTDLVSITFTDPDTW